MARHLLCAWLLLSPAAFLWGSQAWGAEARSSAAVKLFLGERLGVPRRGEPVTTGVPFPRDLLTDARSLRLVRAADGREVRAQFRVTGRWLPGESIRWVLVDFQADLPAGGGEEYLLEYGPGVTPAKMAEPALRVEEGPEGYMVETGAARFVLSRTRFTLFDTVTLADGTLLLSGEGADQAGAVLRGVSRMVTRAIPDPGNQGDHHLIYAEASADAPAEDWNLEFLDEENHYRAVGSLVGPDGTGEATWGKAFRSESGRLILPADAWLVDRQARRGDRFTFSTIPAGSQATTQAVTSSRVCERGPLRTVIEFKGTVGRREARVLEFTAWYHFFAGSSRVQLDFTLENNAHSARTDTGNVTNADIGTPNTVFFDEFALRLPVRVGDDARWTLLGDAESAHLEGSLEAPVELYQDSSGTDFWDRYRDPQYHPRPNSYVEFRGYRVYQGDTVVGEGRHAVGSLGLRGSSGGVDVSVRDFWQNFPKALRVEPAGVLEVALFPGRYQGNFPLRPGEHKTHRLLFQFLPRGRGAPEGADAARAFSDPLILEASAEWWAETQALGVLHPYDPEHFGAYEVRNLSTVGVFPEGFTGERLSLPGQIEVLDFYGWMDYGDVPIDFEEPTGQWNLKYDFDFCMLRQYARTGRHEWLSLFRAAAVHAADIDTFHAPHYPELHFLKGGNWAHSLHDEPGHTNPHRNYNHFTRDLAFATRGPAAFYYLTGDWKAYEATRERAENALAPYMSPQEEPTDRPFSPVGERGQACTLDRLLEGYLLTGEERFRERALWCVKESAFDGRVDPDNPLEFSLWSMAFYALALERYVELFPGEELARRSFLAHADVLANSVDPAGKEGAAYTMTLRADGTFAREGDCAHYNIMIADALAHAYRMTREQRYLAAARKAFAYGVVNACWVGGPPTYSHVHSAAGSTHGNVYMATVSAAGP